MHNTIDFRRRPCDYAMQIIEDGYVSGKEMLEACLERMTKTEIRSMLDKNEWSPRFIGDDPEDLVDLPDDDDDLEDEDDDDDFDLDDDDLDLDDDDEE